MKKVLFSLLMAFITTNFLLAKGSLSEMNIVSFNIRMDTPNDGENQWKFRKDCAADLIKFYNVDIFGAQEVLHHQLTDLLERLPDYDYVGVGRTDGKEKGEYAPIIYKKSRYAVVKTGNFWLAEDKNAVGKKGWDAACERVATWAVLKDKQSGKKFFFLNTHLDHIGKVARHEGAALVLRQVKELAGDMPVIVTGDFNAVETEDPIQVLIDRDNVDHLTDSRSVADLKYGPEWTFHGFGRVPLEKRHLIDYIFIKGNIKVLRHGVLTDTLNHLYPSDHCPIMCVIEI